ncbi:hypothetical protein Y032_0003g1594 [Ancylostoma ceylanicum]|uniref:Uncharacterized protein n=1 Tax=Ancylostoma ceylanicum TaxID=53326 RepID=A0A016VZM4_9BILA|nr:hypothetical protein Y032_0003g1594 [Ancylostoma ceylanicum]
MGPRRGHSRCLLHLSRQREIMTYRLSSVSAQQARCFGPVDNQSASAAVPPLVYDRLEFTVEVVSKLSA